MKLGEKLRYLRLMKGNLRGFGRELTQQEVVRDVTRDGHIFAMPVNVLVIEDQWKIVSSSTGRRTTSGAECSPGLPVRQSSPPPP
jgi:hypothetical protein